MRRGMAAVMMLVILASWSQCVRAEDKEPVFKRFEGTAYVLDGITASGTHVREGICASSDPELKDKTIAIYQRDGESLGEFIGYYEVLDTGCDIHVIDVWEPDLDLAQHFMDRIYANGCNGHIFVQVIDAKG